MRRKRLWRWLAASGGVAALATGAIAAGPALGDGPCGQNYTNATACPVSGTGQTLPGQIVANDDTDHYVFYAAAETHVEASVQDEENAEQCFEDANCSEAKIKLVGPSGTVVAEAATDLFNQKPAASLSYITRKAGVYYIEVSGQLASGGPFTYQVTIAGSPELVWPAPPPSTTPPPGCVVPRLVGLKLAAAKKKLRKAHCGLGKVKHARGRGHHHHGPGRVIASSPKKGRHMKAGAQVRLKVS